VIFVNALVSLPICSVVNYVLTPHRILESAFCFVDFTCDKQGGLLPRDNPPQFSYGPVTRISLIEILGHENLNVL
jgi:hypothetical protein